MEFIVCSNSLQGWQNCIFVRFDDTVREFHFFDTASRLSGLLCHETILETQGTHILYGRFLLDFGGKYGFHQIWYWCIYSSNWSALIFGFKYAFMMADIERAVERKGSDGGGGERKQWTNAEYPMKVGRMVMHPSQIYPTDRTPLTQKLLYHTGIALV